VTDSLGVPISDVKPSPSLWELFFIFFKIGMQSFGGGAATFALICEANNKYGWMEEDEFLETYAISQVAPGVTLIKLTVLLGKKLRGWSGLLAATAGLVLPTSLITILLTSAYTLIKEQPVVQAAMRGILPATIGLTFYISVTLGIPIFKKARRSGWTTLLFTVLLLIGVVLLIIFTAISPVIVLFITGTMVMLYFNLVNKGHPGAIDEVVE
jgi:chromate transporter